MRTLLDFYRLFRQMKSENRASDTQHRAREFGTWTDRASAMDDSPEGYDHAKTVKEYYDLCTEIMEFSWGESLHFAPLSPDESLEDSKIRHQRLMISKLQLQEGMTVIDVGCGIGGPMRRVVREAGVNVLGVNINAFQLGKARSLNAEAGLDHMVDYLETSFMDMGSIADNTFDRGYAIESTCHAPDKAGAFAEIYRVLKPGSLFWGQEMCMTDRFNPDDNQHRAVKQALMYGIALKDIATMGEVNSALKTAGFQIVEGKDRGVHEQDTATPWYQPMDSRHGISGNALYRIPLGRKLALGATGLAEVLRVFPKGSAEVIRILDQAANAYVAGGKNGIFTPLYCFLARKPL